ncbi:MAG: hypothetical protein H0V23_13475 [Nocardioidaceae bacterium]|nr:hypothetical protein [Nocardioidaceae bacterium]
MTDQPHEADSDADDVEGHGRFGHFLDADSAIDDAYPTPPSAPPTR